MEQTVQHDHIGSKYDTDTQTATLKRAESYPLYASKSNLQIAYEALDKSQREKFPYLIWQCGKSFVVLRDVFSPKHLPACELFADRLPFAPGGSFLEIGAGVGVTAIIAACKEARRVVATDINPAAVENIRQNVVLHGLSDSVDVRQGSLYEPLKPDETFDLIFWNIPFLLVEPNRKLSLLQRSVADPSYRAAECFLRDGRHYLTPGRVV